MDYTKKIIKEAFKSAADEIADSIASDELTDATSAIATDNQLSQGQENILAHEILLLLLGFTIPDKFIDTLSTKLSLNTETSTKIASQVGEKILSKIPENILHVQEEYTQAKLKEAGDTAFIAPTAVPEIAPVILPEEVPGQTAHDAPHTEQASIPVPDLIPTPIVTPTTVVETPAQSPIATPAAPEQAPAVPIVPFAPKSIVGEKLTQVTSATTQTPNPPAYESTDPYREPLI